MERAEVCTLKARVSTTYLDYKQGLQRASPPADLEVKTYRKVPPTMGFYRRCVEPRAGEMLTHLAAPKRATLILGGNFLFWVAAQNATEGNIHKAWESLNMRGIHQHPDSNQVTGRTAEMQ